MTTLENVRGDDATVIRLATPEDAAALAVMLDAMNIEDGQPAGCFREDLVRRDAFGADPAFAALLACRDERTVGYALFLPFYNTELARHGLWMLDLWIEPRHRRRGIGRRLVAALAQRTLVDGRASLWWTVRNGNAAARAFYAALGAKDDETRLLELDGAPLAALGLEAGAARMLGGVSSAMRMTHLYPSFGIITSLLLASTALGQSGKPPLQFGIQLATDRETEITQLTTKLVVPPLPAAPADPADSLFIWPGLQPWGVHYLPIGNGVLQSVLTFGPSCAPGEKPTDFSRWWISAQYVNTWGHHPHFAGCRGGDVMAVDPGDVLLINMALFRSTWTQSIVDVKTGRSVSYRIDLEKQAQNRARFVVEPWSAKLLPIADVTFLDTLIAYSDAHAGNCAIEPVGGAESVVSPPLAVDGGRACYIAKMTLRASRAEGR